MDLTELEQYIETGNHQDLDLLLSKSPELLNNSTSHDISPLLLACYYDKKQVVQTILKHTQTINIHEACAVGLLVPVEGMISQQKSIVDQISENGFTPLGLASHFGNEDIVRCLLLHGADPNTPSQNGYNVYPLHAALSNNYSNIAKMLIEAGAHVNVRQNLNITPMHLAVQYGNIDLIILLLEHGADISIRNDSGQNPSDVAAEKGFSEISAILKVD